MFKYFNTLSVLALLAILGFIAYRVYIMSKKLKIEQREKTYTIYTLLEAVRDEIRYLLRDDTFAGTEREAEDRDYRAMDINYHLPRAVKGHIDSRDIIKNLVREIVLKFITSESIADATLDLNSPTLSYNYKFELLMYHFGKELEEGQRDLEHSQRNMRIKLKALEKWVKKYNLSDVKYIIEDGKTPSYVITEEEVDYSLKNENIVLNYNDKVNIISTIIYSKYVGLGNFDTLRFLNCNGYNLGTSGSALSHQLQDAHSILHSYWVNLQGKMTHFRFLKADSLEELNRIIRLCGGSSTTGTLTEKNAVITTTSPDFTRVVIARNPFAHASVAFMRKFSDTFLTPEFLILGSKYKNAILAYKWYKFSFLGLLSTIISGRQGSGKTVNLVGGLSFHDARYTLRGIEKLFEAYLNERMPERNSAAFQETAYQDEVTGRDTQKKSDGSIAVITEMATDQSVVTALQLAQSGSLATFTTHHGTTAINVINAMADAIVAIKSTELNAAREQVARAFGFNIHHDFTTGGVFYIQHMTEIVVLDTDVPYPEVDPSKVDYSKAVIDREFYTRTTNRRVFDGNELVRFDLETLTYYPVHIPTPEFVFRIAANLGAEQRVEFAEFLMEWYGDDYSLSAETPLRTQVFRGREHYGIDGKYAPKSREVLNGII